MPLPRLIEELTRLLEAENADLAQGRLATVRAQLATKEALGHGLIQAMHGLEATALPERLRAGLRRLQAASRENQRRLGAQRLLSEQLLREASRAIGAGRPGQPATLFVNTTA